MTLHKRLWCWLHGHDWYPHAEHRETCVIQHKTCHRCGKQVSHTIISHDSMGKYNR